MHIHIITAVWKRPDITKIFLDHFQYLQQFVPDGDQLTMTVVKSPGDKWLRVSDPAAILSGVLITEHENRPLGAKWNWALQSSRSVPYDYALILGSDDFMNKDLMLWLFAQAHAGVDFAGLEDLWILHGASKVASYWGGYTNTRKTKTIGAGRLLSRRVLEACNWQLWSMTKERGLDGSMGRMITPHLRTLGSTTSFLRMLPTGCRLFDLKSSQNLNSFKDLDQTRITFSKFLRKHYYPELAEAIKSL